MDRGAQGATLAPKPDTDNPAGATQRRRTAVPAVPAVPAAGYAPGTIRTSTDREAALVDAFFRHHPEYEILPRDVVLAVAATYLDDADHREREALADEGVEGVAPYGFSAPGVSDNADDDKGSDYQ